LVHSGGEPNNEAAGESASIAQVGLVPSKAESIQFDAFAENPFSVSFAGNQLDPIVLSSGVSADGLPYNLYGANISAWAGDVGQLEFTAVYNNADPYFVLDDIAFSSQSVPEPSPLLLTGIGGVLCGLYRRLAPGRASAVRPICSAFSRPNNSKASRRSAVWKMDRAEGGLCPAGCY
jgi:hypothetical protein